MHEELNQKISQLVDNELADDEALSLLRKLHLQPELQGKLNRYEAISHAIKTEVFILPGADFATRVSQQIQQEPSYLLPPRQSAHNNYKIWAIAASVAAVAVIASWNITKLLAPAQPIGVVSVAKAPKQQTVVKDTELASRNLPEEIPLNQRINDYLQAHNNSVYTNGEANFKPYTRVTAYSKE